MTKGEAAKLMAVLSAAYPNFVVTEATLEVWYRHLFDLDYRQADAAVSDHIATSRFAPSIAEVRESALRDGSLPTEGDAWGQALSAVNRFGFYRKDEALTAMHPLVAHAVERFGWDEFCRADSNGVTMGLFLRVYRGMSERAERELLYIGGPEREQLRGGEVRRIGSGS